MALEMEQSRWPILQWRQSQSLVPVRWCWHNADCTAQCPIAQPRTATEILLGASSVLSTIHIPHMLQQENPSSGVNTGARPSPTSLTTGTSISPYYLKSFHTFFSVNFPQAASHSSDASSLASAGLANAFLSLARLPDLFSPLHGHLTHPTHSRTSTLLPSAR